MNWASIYEERFRKDWKYALIYFTFMKMIWSGYYSGQISENFKVESLHI